ncbi:MAG: hypothetical protein IRZ28_00715 [Steroidobacteraceae bacterium]|nr:hypothetical protein [Steroidobacteraceae bacterium]
MLTNLERYDEAYDVLVTAERKKIAALGKDHPRTQSARTVLKALERRPR